MTDDLRAKVEQALSDALSPYVHDDAIGEARDAVWPLIESALAEEREKGQAYASEKEIARLNDALFLSEKHRAEEREKLKKLRQHASDESERTARIAKSFKHDDDRWRTSIAANAQWLAVLKKLDALEGTDGR